LRLSAANAGCYSLSANQIGISNAMFVIHKEAMNFLHPKAFALQSSLPTDDEMKRGVSEENLLNPEDYETIINPRIVSETVQ
jgi:peptide deformylase